MSEGTRTPDRLDHNQELYQLSYAHQDASNLAVESRPGIGAGTLCSRPGMMRRGQLPVGAPTGTVCSDTASTASASSRP